VGIGERPSGNVNAIFPPGDFEADPGFLPNAALFLEKAARRDAVFVIGRTIWNVQGWHI
jgi:hypothetical protein